MLRTSYILLLAACVPLALPGQSVPTLYRAARIYTMEADSVYTHAPAVGVRDHRIVAVGDSATVAGRLSADGDPWVVDTSFARAVLFPGFVEAHTHMQSYGIFTSPRVTYVGYWDWMLPDTTLHGVPTVDSLVAVLRNAVAAHADTALPLLAYGADPIYFGGIRLTRQILDRASTTTPIVVQLSSGHILVCNTAMLKKVQAGADWNALLASPGTVIMGPDGPTGELDESLGVDAVQQVLLGSDTALARVYFDSAATWAAPLMRAAGITTASDLWFGDGPRGQDTVSRGAYERAAASDSMFPRVYLAYSAPALVRNHGDSAVAYLTRVRQGDTNKIRTGPVKVVLDGSIQGYTGVLSTPYANPPAPGANPFWNVPPQSLDTLVLPFWKAGFQLAVHVNGDSATQVLIGTLRRLLTAYPRTDHRTTFEHNQSAFQAQYDSIRALGATVNLFPGHIWFWGPQHERYTLGTRAADLAPADWAIERGIPFSLHSDAPVTQAAPMFAVWAAVTRRMPTPAGDSVLGPAHRISVGQAMRAITLGGAYLLHAEDEIGSIRPGKLADFTALDRDPFAVPQDELCHVRVVGTVIGGMAAPQRLSLDFCPSRPGGDGGTGRR